MSNKKNVRAESGFVAIFTVIFFTILITILTLGFLRVMIDERRQSTDNDLTATALNAAYAGIEDGKRVLMYCTENPSDADCGPALSTTSCPGVFSSSSLAGKLGVSLVDGAVQVSNTAGIEEHYTCLTINSITNEYIASIDAFQSDLVPLKGVNPFSQLEISWHDTSPDEQGTPGGYPSPATELPNVQDWTSAGYPSYLRIQYMQHSTSSSIDLTALDETSRSAFLSPAGAGGIDNFTLNDRDIRSGTSNYTVGSREKNQIVPVRCAVVGTYACSVVVNLPGTVDPATMASYLRVSSVYGKTSFRVKLLNGGSLVRLDGAQPVVDATGRSNDVFRRVQARVRMDGSAFYPQFALESGKDICKHFLVTDSAAQYTDYCGGGGGGGGGGSDSCTIVSSSHSGDKWVGAAGSGNATEIPITLATPLQPGCKYRFMYEWGDNHIAQQEACEGGSSHPGWYSGVCNVWKQPYESFFIEFRTATGQVVDITPHTGDIPDRFTSADDPYWIISPNGVSGAEAKQLFYNLDLTGAPAEITHIVLKHSTQTPTDNKTNSAHLYEFLFTPQ